jgi:uncharacterized membrane protein (UPF0127 family)
VLELRSKEGTPLYRLEVAESWLARLRGLIGRAELASGEGLFLPGTNGVHMLFMRFPIDCVFVGKPRPDGSREVVAVRDRLRPWTGIVWWARGADGVAEVPAGSVETTGLRRGDLVRLEPA